RLREVVQRAGASAMRPAPAGRVTISRQKSVGSAGGRGVQGGVAAPRSAAEGDRLRIPPGTGNAPKERTLWSRQGVQGGVAAPRSAAEGDRLRIPPGTGNAPKERTLWSRQGVQGGVAAPR